MLGSGVSLAQTVQVRGAASVNYDPVLTPAIKNQAIEKARLKAVEKYFADAGEAEMENFDRNLATIQSKIETFTDDPVKLSELDDPANKRYSVSVRVELNVARLRNAIKSTSAVAGAAPGGKSKVVFVFVGREVASVKTFDDRVVKQATSSSSIDAKSQKKGVEGEKITSSSVTTTADQRTQVSQDAAVRVETGGSSTRKSAEVERRIFPTNDLDVSIKGTFSQAGFDTRDAAFVLSEKLLNSLTKEFTTANKPSPTSLKATATELQKGGIPYFAVATLDVGSQDTDPATGQPRVNVSVTGEIYDLTDWPPRTLAAVGPVQITGVGPDPEAARRQALSKAARDGTRELVSRVNVTGLR
jgi:hypothetical protein